MEGSFADQEKAKQLKKCNKTMQKHAEEMNCHLFPLKLANIQPAFCLSWLLKHAE